MATLSLHTASNPRVLLEAAAEPFLAPARPTAENPFPTPPCLLALRQGGLRDDLIAMARSRGVRGWFDPPLILFADLPSLLVGERRAHCGDFERVVLLADVLRCSPDGVLAGAANGERFVDAVDRLLGDLVSGGVDADALELALQQMPDRDPLRVRRDADIASAHRIYLTRLSQAGMQDARRRLLDAAHAVLHDSGGIARRLQGRRELRLLGLQDLRAGWRDLLDALRSSPAIDRIGVYTSVRLDRAEGLRPDEVVALDEPASWVTRLFSGSAMPAPEPVATAVEILEAPDLQREVEQVAVRVRALLDRGVGPERIAVVARHARPLLDLVLGALAQVGVPATARRRHRFVEIPVVRSILSLFAVARDGFSRHGLVELAQQPYLGLELDAVVLNHIGYRRRVEGLDAWSAALDTLLREAQAQEQRLAAGDEEQDRRRSAAPSAARVTQAIASFREFAAKARALTGQRTLREWVDWLHSLVTDGAWGIEQRLYDVPDGSEEIVRLDMAGLRGARTIIGEWRQALDRWGGGDAVFDAAGFEARARTVLSGDAALWTHSRQGVQVLEGLAAAHRNFDHVFLVGLAAGRFPLPAPRSPIFDEAEREALIAAGLPLESRARWDNRERELFRALAATAQQSLVLSWARLDERGGETVPSAFLEEVADCVVARPTQVATGAVLTAGLPLITSRAAPYFAAHAARIERDRATGRLSPWNGQIQDATLLAWLAAELGDSYSWSPTQLESYAKCPWAWFSARLLHLQKFDDPDIDIDPRSRGSLLHDALKRFFDAARTRLGGPVMMRAADLEAWAAALLERCLDEAVAAAPADLWLGQPALRETKHAELRRMLQRYMAWEADQNEKLLTATRGHAPRTLRTAADEHEVAFDDLVLSLDGVNIRLRGSIDRVDVAVDDRVPNQEWIAAIDYKTTIWSTPGMGHKSAWQDGVVLQVPLYAWALTQLRPETRVARIEYRAIKTRETAHSLELVQVRKQGRSGFALESQPEQQARMWTALSAVAGHVRAVRDGRFPARPAPSCKCPSFCHAWEICRVKGGPQSKW
jgi:RecB family exonuclease